jgi:mRNA interferase RelE/StbE
VGGAKPYDITLGKQALKYLVRMRPADGKRVRVALDRLAANPDRQDMDIKPLQGRPAFRLRVGNYRVIFQRDDVIRVLAVERIAPRGDVYKG